MRDSLTRCAGSIPAEILDNRDKKKKSLFTPMSLKMAADALHRIELMERRMKEAMTSGMPPIHRLIIKLMSLMWMTWILRAPRMALRPK